MTRAPWVQAKPDRRGRSRRRLTTPRSAGASRTPRSCSPRQGDVLHARDGRGGRPRRRHHPRGRRRLRRPQPAARRPAAIAAGRFEAEIVRVPTRTRRGARHRRGPAPRDHARGARRAPPVVHGGSVVTAGNSSTLNDGASAIIVASGAAIERLRPHAPRTRHRRRLRRLRPEIMGIGPVPATEKALERSRPQLDDIGAVELNEAFATQSLASMRRLGLDPERQRRRRRDRPGASARFVGLAARRDAARPHGARGRRDTASPPCASASARAPRCIWSGSDAGRSDLHPAGFAEAPLLIERRDDRVVATSTGPRSATPSTRRRSTRCTPSAPSSRRARAS